MQTRRQLDIQISELETLKVVSQAYAQIASFRIKKMRDTVLITRSFLGEVSLVFQSVLQSYRAEAEKLAKKSGGIKGKKITFLSHNGRTAAVFLSANSRLYGDLIARTFETFAAEVGKQDLEVTIVGKYGLSLFEDRFVDKPFSYFDFPDAATDQNALKTLITHLAQYEEIRFFYPQFQNAVTQKPTILRLTAGEVITQEKTGSEVKQSYLFEPSLEAILAFFETQIFSSLIEQTIKESQLAKFASRVLSMDRASEKIREELARVEITKLKLRHQLVNKKQTQMLTTIMY